MSGPERLHTGVKSKQILADGVGVRQLRREVYQEMGKHVHSHICRAHGMIGVVRSLVQRELRMAKGKLRPERCMQGLFHDVSHRPCCGVGFCHEGTMELSESFKQCYSVFTVATV